MKKIFIALFSIGCMGISHAQMVGQLFTATLKPGVNPNSIKAVIKSSATFTGKFSNVQLTFQIPNTILPRPVVTILNNPLSTYIPTAAYLPLLSDEGGFYNYLFGATTAGSPNYNFIAGTEIDALEVRISCCPSQTAQLRLAQVPNGGASGQMNYYIEVSGNDNTNTTAPFYGAGAINGGGAPYTAYSYSLVNNVALPIKLTGFRAIKKDKDALLTWAVENQGANQSHFEVERSFNGTDFIKIGRVEVNLNTGSAATYNFTDVNIIAARTSGIVYYRIKQVDKDGKFSYSEIKNIKLDDKAFGVNLYPNPAKNYTNVTIDLPDASAISIRITDAGGKEMRKIEVAGARGVNQKRIDLSGFASGSYLVKVYASNQSQTISLVKAE